MGMRIGHLRLTVTDLERWMRFAQEIVGLRLVETSGETAWFSSNSRHHQLELTQGSTYACTALGLDVDSLEEMLSLADRAGSAGVPVSEIDSTRVGIASVITLEPAGGPALELCTGVQSLPAIRYGVYGVRPRKLGHVTLAAEDHAALERFFVDVLGFRVSDRIPDLLCWLRCNADHHGIGLMGGAPGVQHYAFELEGWSSFESLADHMVDHGVTYIWGPGRHGPGNNLFAYFEDPDGGMIEVFADILRIDDESAHRPLDWPDSPTSLNQWGPGPAPAWFEYRTPLAPTFSGAVV